MTARELYQCDPGFRGFIAAWVDARRCPLELVDYLLDRDMADQAERARYVAGEPDRKVFIPARTYGERGGWCGPFPTIGGAHDEAKFMSLHGQNHDWYWFNYSPDVAVAVGSAHELQSPLFRSDMHDGYLTMESALLGLLDGFPEGEVK